MREYVMDKQDKDLIRSVQLVLLSWGNENPHDAELVSHGVGLLNRIADSGKEDKKMDRKAGRSLLVYTMDDCDALCAILCRNGYCTVAHEVITAVSSEIVPKRWCISYYDPKDVTRSSGEDGR